MSWKNNPIMEWYDPRPGSQTQNQWVKISDHGRGELSIGVERIETKQRMANGTMRRYVTAKKRTWSTSWDNFPNVAGNFLVNGQAGNWMEKFHNEVDGPFKIRFRTGQDQQKATTHTSIEEATVMITDFSKNVVKRGLGFDLWSLDITLEEV